MKKNLYYFISGFAFLFCTSVFATDFNQILQKYSINNAIQTMQYDDKNQKLYIGGHFTLIQTKTAGGAFFNELGKFDDNSLVFNGRINAVVSDRQNGFFIAGQFSNLENSGKGGLIHLLADGTIDPNFIPAINQNINAMFFDSDKLYVSTGKKVYLLTLSGQLIPSFNLTIDGSISTLFVNQNGLYVGGYLMGANGHALRHFVKADKLTGAVDLAVRPNLYGTVKSIYAEGDAIYLGGFQSMKVSDKDYQKWMIKISNTDGAFDPNFRPVFNRNSYPAQIIPHDGFLYVAARNSKMQRINPTTGQADPSFEFPVSGDVKTVFTDQYIYAIGGFYHTQSGKRFNQVARYYLNDLRLDESYHPQVNSRITVADVSGNKLILGGFFTGAGRSLGKHFARIDLQTSRIDSGFSELVNGAVSAIALVDDKLYIGGKFTKVGSKTVARLAKLNINTLEADPDFKVNFNGQVTKVLPHHDAIYVGGMFSRTNNRPNYKYVVKLNSQTGALAEDFKPMPNHWVWDLAIHDNSIFVSGYFREIAGSTSTPYLAKLDKNTGLKDQHFSLYTDRTVRSLIIKDNALYLGGYFRLPGGITYLAKVDVITGEIDQSFRPQPQGVILKLFLVDNLLYASGHFKQVGENFPSLPIAHFIRMKPEDGEVDENFDLDLDQLVFDLIATDKNILIGGYFKSFIKSF